MPAVYLILGLAIVLALLALRGDHGRATYVAEKLSEPIPDSACPPATIIVPVKGNDETLAANLLSLASQTYPDYELIIVARAKEDVPPDVLPEKARLVIAGDGDPSTGEKINNLLAAIKAARSQSKIFAFADSDNTVNPNWLRSLAGPLADPNVGLATGYRWHVPTPPDFWSCLRSSWNAAIAGTFHGDNNSFAWGGAMAIRRETFTKGKVSTYWKGTVSDDFRISHAVRATSLRIVYAPGAVVADTSHTTAAEFFSWIKRQLIVTRVYEPKLWWMAFTAHVIYCTAMPLGAIYAPFVLVLQLWLGMVKGRNRAKLARACLPAHDSWFRYYGWIHTIVVPFATWIWLFSLLASARTTTIEWRGRTYTLRSPAKS